MKAKKIAKRLRKLSAEFHARALNYDAETLAAERARHFMIGDVCQVLADEVFATLAVKRDKKRNERDSLVPVRGKDGTTMGWKAAD
jgi:hypothetical protein